MVSTRASKARKLFKSDDAAEAAASTSGGIAVGSIGGGGSSNAAGSAGTGTGGEENVFASVGEDAMRHIFGFALGKRSNPSYARSAYALFREEERMRDSSADTLSMMERWNYTSHVQQARFRALAEADRARYDRQQREMKVWGADGLVKSCRDFSLVSRLFRDVTGDVMNLQAPSEVISPRALSQLKHKVASLSLSSVRENFVNDVKAKWGGAAWTDFIYCECENCSASLEQCEEEGTSPLDDVVVRLGGGYDAFSKIAAREYRRFLVVKCVETIATNKPTPSGPDGIPPTLAVWREKCQPTNIVDMMWHTHMLDPVKYHADCLTLVGELIGHDQGYISPETQEGSDLESKKKVLFSFEMQFPDKEYYGGKNFHSYKARQLFAKKFGFAGMVANIIDEMSSYGDCG